MTLAQVTLLPNGRVKVGVIEMRNADTRALPNIKNKLLAYGLRESIKKCYKNYKM